jgi:hypothetical protein
MSSIRPENEAQSVSGMLSIARFEIVVLVSLGLLSFFVFISTGSGRGPVLQQFDMSNPLTISTGIVAVLLFLPWCLVLFATFYSNGQKPRYLSSMPALQAHDFKSRPRWRRFVAVYVWAVSLGTSLNPVSTKCPKCGSTDIRSAGPKEYAEIALGGIIAVPVALLITFAYAHLVDGVGFAAWVNWRRALIISVPILVLFLFRTFIHLPKLRFCKKCNFGGFVPPSPVSMRQAEIARALADPAVREAWVVTWRAWGDGLYSPNAQREARSLSVESFCNKYSQLHARLVSAAAKQRPFEPGEFIVTVGQKDSCLLTNLAFYLFTKDRPIPNPALVVSLSDINDFRVNVGGVLITLHSGEIIRGLTDSWPKVEIANRFIKAAQTNSAKMISRVAAP